MSIWFQPYEGRRPYFFVSYSHRDSRPVLDVITPLHEKKLRLWYDEGIPAGSDWPRSIESHMRGCGGVLFFLSAGSMASPNCFSEIKTAVRLKKPVVCVPLDDSVPEGDWVRLLADAETVSVGGGATPEAIRAAKAVKRSFYRRWWTELRWDRAALVLSALLLLASAAGLGAILTGKLFPPAETAPVSPHPTAETTAAPAPTPVPEVDLSRYGSLFSTAVSFPDSLQELAVRTALDVRSGEVPRSRLTEIRSLAFCGSLAVMDESAVSYDPAAGWSVNGVAPGKGRIRDLSLIGTMPYLETLGLIAQPVTDLAPLAGLVFLRELDLSGSGAEDLSPLAEVPGLETLALPHSAVRDLTPLAAHSWLRRVTVSADMLPLTCPAERNFEIILVP